MQDCTIFWLAMLSGPVSLVLAHCPQQLLAPADRGAISGSHQVPQVPKHVASSVSSDHLLTHDDATLLHNMLIYDACCVTGNIPNCMSNVALATHGVKAPWQQLAKFQNSSVWTVMMCLSSRDTHHVLCSISGAWQLALHLIACSCKLVPQAAC